MAEILVVDDEEAINKLIKSNLTLIGHHCTQAYDGREALEKLREQTYDLVILDVMLPYQSGFEVMRQIKDTPVIFLTAKDRLEDKLEGLTSGAEDYIVKPFEILELIARVNVVLRRTQKSSKIYQIGETEVNIESQVVKHGGQIVDLKPQEYALLEVLLNNRNLALSREKLLELAWGYEYEGDTRTVDVHIQQLRKKLGLEQVIKTVYKVGYRLEA